MSTHGQRWLSHMLPPWWALLITGVSWVLLAMIILRFSYTSVYAISLLFGFVALAAGVLELSIVAMSSGWWKLFNGILAFAYIAAGLIGFWHPGDTFVALAAVFSFFLIFAGTFDIIESISAKDETHAWWLQLVGGIILLLIGFWAAEDWGRSAVLLVAWVGAFAIIRGVRDIVLAFRVREMKSAA